MTQLLLIQPGATEYDRQGRIQGTLDVPLSELGRQQVEALLGQLQEFAPTAIYSCCGEASRQTAEQLGESLGLKPRTLERLANVDQGLWQGLRMEEVKTKQPKVFRQWREHPETVCPPQGETIPHAKQRVAEVLQKVIKRHKPEGKIALVAPEPLASIIRHLVLQCKLSELWQPQTSTAHCEVLEIAPPVASPTGS